MRGGTVTATVKYADVEPGTELEPKSYQVTRLNLVQYAGASGDFTPIHWNERVAPSVGLPNVIAHGMFTMAEAGRFASEWAGDPGAVVEFGVRFSAPVVVPDDDQGATIEIGGPVGENRDGNRAPLAVVAGPGGTKVLTRARAVVVLP